MAKAVTSAAAARQVKRVAVVPFTAPRGAGSYSGAIVSERLVIQILARGELDLVERRFLAQILEGLHAKRIKIPTYGDAADRIMDTLMALRKTA